MMRRSECITAVMVLPAANEGVASPTQSARADRVSRTGSAAALAARCKKGRRGSFTASLLTTPKSYSKSRGFERVTIFRLWHFCDAPQPEKKDRSNLRAFYR